MSGEDWIAERGEDIDVSTTTDVPRTILNKITSGVDPSIEKPGLRPFRELLQNSDDAQATTMTLRFDKDRLILHNDGFTIERKFVEHLASFFGASKEKDPETSGNFGTGFRSTYMYTDSPELEWLTIKEAGVLSYRVYEVPMGVDEQLKWQRIDESVGGRYKTFGRENEEPDDKGVTRLGVIFRFPWRTRNKWPDRYPGWDNYTWNADSIRTLAEDFRDYAATALLACRHLRRIRIVMAGAAKNDEEMWDFVVTRDATISEIWEGSSNSKPIEEEINLTFATLDRQTSFFDSKSGKWSRTPDSGHHWYDHKTLDQEVSESEDRTSWSYSVYGDIREGRKAGVDEQMASQLKFWNMALLLLPRFPDAPKLPIFTPIPLAGKTTNRFGIISILPPEESRLNVSVSEDLQKEWLMANITAISGTYSEFIERHIDSLRDELQGEDFEKTVIACIPRDAPNTWFGQGGQLTEIARVNSEARRSEAWDYIDTNAIRLLSQMEIAWVGGSIVPLSETCYSWGSGSGATPEMEQILELIRAPRLSRNWEELWREINRYSSTDYFEDVIEYWLFTHDPDELKNTNRVGSMSVASAESFSRIVENNWKNAKLDGELDICSQIILSGICQNNLVEGGWIEDEYDRMLDIPSLITEQEGLIGISEVMDTNKIPALAEILPDYRLVKESVRQESIESINAIRWSDKFREAIRPTGNRILKLIDHDTRLRPEVHADLEAHDSVYKAVSTLLRAAFDSSIQQQRKASLADSEIRTLRFVPCLRWGKVSTMQQNIIEKNGEPRLTWGFGPLQEHNTSNYHREFIFKDDPASVFDLLPEQIAGRLRFLKMHPDVVSNLVSDALKLNITGQGNKKTNLLRTLLFEHDRLNLNSTQPSLYHPEILEEWLPNPMHQSPGAPLCPECEGTMTWSVRHDSHCDCCGEENSDSAKNSDYHWWTCDCDESGVDYCIGCEDELEWQPIIENPGIEGIEDLDEIKLRMLTSLLGPYEEISSEFSRTESIPLVLGEDGEWRTGGNYCLSLGSEVSQHFDELASVDERIIDSVSGRVLRQLGVQDTLGPKAALGVILEMCEQGASESESISQIMLALLSSEQVWSQSESKEERDAWEELMEDHAWIPTIGGDLLFAEEVLFPSESNVEQMGSLYENLPLERLLDGKLNLWERMRESCEANSKDIGMIATPTDGMLMLAFCGYHTDANNQSIAVNALSKKLSRKDSIEFSELDWGPHGSIGTEDFNVTLRYALSDPLVNDPEIWIVREDERKQELEKLFGERFQIATNHNLEHVDKIALKALRKLGLLRDGPSLLQILEELSKEHNDPIIVDGLWVLLLEHPVPEYGTEGARFLNSRPAVKFCFDDNSDVILLSDGLIMTSDQARHGEIQLDGRMLYYAEDGSNVASWFDELYVPLERDVSNFDLISSLEGQEFELVDQRIPRIKKILPRIENGVFLIVWAGKDAVELIRIDEDYGAYQAINPILPNRRIREVFRDFPIIHMSSEDDENYLSWVKELDCEGVISINDVIREEPDTEGGNFSANASLTAAFAQITTALGLIYPEFKNSNDANATCRMGRGGIPIIITMEWDGREEETVGYPVEQTCLYIAREDELKVFIDEDDSIGNAISCSTLLAEGLIDKAPWFGDARERNKATSGGFMKDVTKLIRILLETPTDEWADINSKLDRDWEPHGRLFESNTAYQMRKKLTGMYGGCQICGAVTPTSEHSHETKESLISIITERGGPYYGKKNHKLPLGTQLWVCPRHRILWERKLIRLSFIEQSFEGRYLWGRQTIPETYRILGISRMRELRDNWEGGISMEVEVYDQTMDFTGGRSLEPRWNKMSMDVTEEHAKEIINRMIGLLDD